MEGTNVPITDKDDVFAKMEKQAIVGEKIVKAIVITSYIFLVFDFISSFILHSFGLLTIPKLILWAVVYYKLYAGRAWAKWLYIIATAIGIIILLVTYWDYFGIVFSIVSQAPYLYLGILLLVSMAFTVAHTVFCLLLLFSKSVNEFLYRQSTD